jgi:hypothetical protein
MHWGWWRHCGAVLVLVCIAPAFAVADATRVAPPPAAPYLKALTPDLLARLERERTVMLPSDDAAPGVAEGLVIFAQSYDQVWDLLVQTERHREYRKELTELTNVERFENGTVERHRIRVLFVRLTYHLRFELTPAAWHIEWSLAPNYENGMEQISGTWDLFELGRNRTLGRLGSTVRVGGGMPRSLQNAVTRKNLPETLDHVRRWVDSGGTWRP